ncbi:DEAD/DEAH box helicase [Myroides odoratus]|uniref:DEAD/DEAH box helicase n=1 Tax=Myroides odoratus TaxID=256 RepID=UPI0039AFE94F
MKLKKIHPVLQNNLNQHGFVEPTILQKSTFGRIKSGQDFVLIAPKEEGKTTALLMAALQRADAPVDDMVSTRVLLVVRDKFEVERLVEEFDRLGDKMGIRVYGVHDYTNLDDDKNQMSLGNDILIGTAERLNLMFSGAGFDVNQLKMYAIDDVDQQLRSRLEPRLYRLSESIGKTQRVYFATNYVEALDMFVEKTMAEDVEWLDFYEDDEEE